MKFFDRFIWKKFEIKLLVLIIILSLAARSCGNSVASSQSSSGGEAMQTKLWKQSSFQIFCYISMSFLSVLLMYQFFIDVIEKGQTKLQSARRIKQMNSIRQMNGEDYFMLPTFIAIIAILALIVLWIISTQRKLVVLNENVCNAMSQIGMQLSGRFDAIITLLNLTKGYARHESDILIETINSRSVITSKSTPDDVVCHERIISEALNLVAVVAELYPELKANQDYIKVMDALETFENMLRTSRLIYNDSVTKLDREIRIFPVSMVAVMLGFRQRDYLEEKASKVRMPGMN